MSTTPLGRPFTDLRSDVDLIHTRCINHYSTWCPLIPDPYNGVEEDHAEAEAQRYKMVKMVQNVSVYPFHDTLIKTLTKECLVFCFSVIKCTANVLAMQNKQAVFKGCLAKLAI